MQNSKLTTLLRTFSTAEWRRFREFVASPYFNKHTETMRLAEAFAAAAERNWPPAELASERLYRQTFGATPFDARQLRYVANLLQGLAEQFLAIERYGERPEPAWLDAMAVCSERGLDKTVRLLDRRLEKALTESEELGGSTDWFRLRLERTRLANAERQNQRHTQTQYENLAVALDRYYLLHRRALSCDLQEYARQHPGAELPVRAEWIDLLDSDPRLSAGPAMELYRALQALLRGSATDAQALERYRTLLFTHGMRFPDHRRRVLFYFAVNYAVRAYLAGEAEFADQLFALYDQGLAAGFLLWEDRLSPRDFNNITKLALGLEQYDWLENFIERYASKLPPEAYEDAYHFARADLAYNQGDYNAAMDHLNRVEFSDLSYQVGAKALLLRIYYETGAIDAFESLAASFRLFLLRKRELKPHLRQAYQNFVRLAVRIARARPGERSRIQEQIEGTKTLNARSWLLRQTGRPEASAE